MEIVILLVVLGMLVIVFRQISAARQEIENLRSEVKEWNKAIRQAPDPKPAAPPAPKVVPSSPVASSPVQPASTPVEDHTAKTASVFEYKPERALSISDFDPQKKEGIPASPGPQPGWFSRWLRDNPDIEKFIGENLINKIGIAVLVLGVAFFVKYAIDQEWISKTGRVCIGLLCGVMLVWLANRLRTNYHAFSSVLCGGGIAIFYFTIAFAFHQYQLIGQSAAFGCMVLITIFAVLLSILYDRIELGILAAAGGFITPFLVSQGDGNWFVLFSYLVILNAGLIVLAYYKRWRTINFIAFFFTQAIYLGWIISRTGTPGFNYEGIFLFGLVFYLMFLVMNIVHHVLRSSPLKAFDFVILLSVNLCFYGAGMHLIAASNVQRFSGMFTAALGALNFALAYLFFKRSKADRKFIYLLIGITVSFLSLAAPVQLKGHYITLFWAAEVVVLLWLYQKSFISLLKVTVLLVTLLMLGSLVLDWMNEYGSGVLRPVIFNKGLITGLFSALSLWLVFRLLQKEADAFFLRKIPNRTVRSAYLVTAVAVLYISGALETADQISVRVPGTALYAINLQTYSALFAFILLIVLGKRKTSIHPALPVLLPLTVLLWYGLNIPLTGELETVVLTSGKFRLLFATVFVDGIILLALIFNTVKYIRRNHDRFSSLLRQLTWIFSVCTVMVMSSLIRNIYIWVFFSSARPAELLGTVFDKAGLTIVWAVASFAMIWLGMRYRYKPLRITALVLFGITLIKLFLVDIRNITAGGKILAFILLGVLLLVISFMYQRLKKIIIDEPDKTV